MAAVPPPVPSAAAPAEAAVQTLAKTVSIIVPPPDLKVVVDRTADFVKRVGMQFEKEIQARNAKNKKFDFLKMTSPYHAYYKARIIHGENVDQVVAANAGASGPDQPMSEEATAAALAKAALAKEEKKLKKKKKKKVETLADRMRNYVKQARAVKEFDETKEPPKDRYTIKIPDMFALVDIDIIRVTSQFVARNGRNFLSGLTAREARNPQFDFLKPTHPLFSLFQKLVDSYTKIIIPPKEQLEGITARLANTKLHLEDALRLAKLEAINRDLTAKNETKEEEERVAMQLIDWHAFVVAETLTFIDADDDYLPVPRDTIEAINSMLQAKQVAPEEEPEDGGEDMDMGDDMEMGDDEDMDTNHDDDSRERRMEVLQSEPEPEKVSALPTARTSASDRAMRFQKCPVCGDEIAIEDLSEHMRIELLDPRWKEKKQALADKQKASSLAANNSISANLNRMARRRSDIFISDGDDGMAKSDSIDQRADNTWKAHQAQMRKAAEAEQAAKLAAAEAAKQRQQQQMRQMQAAPPSIHGRPQRPPMMGNPMMQQGAAPPNPFARPPQMPPPPQQQQQQQQQRPPPMPANPHARPPMPPRPPMSMPGIHARPPPTAPPGAAPPARPQMPQMPQMPSMPARPQMPQMPQMPPGSQIPGIPGMRRPPGAYPPGAFPPAGGAPGGYGGTTRPPPTAQPDGEPSAKRSKPASGASGGLSEEEWKQKFPGPIAIKIEVPNDPGRGDWGFKGQVLDLEFQAGDKVAVIKAKLSTLLGNMPSKKMKINFKGGTFLNKDAWTLARYNVSPGSVMQLGVKERGGKR